MADPYQTLVHSSPGRFVASRLGLPQPVRLRRYSPGQPLLAGPALVGGAGRLLDPVGRTLEAAGALAYALADPAAASTSEAEWSPATDPDRRFAALVFDATGITATAGLRSIYEFFHAAIRPLERSGRLLVLGTPPEAAGSAAERIAQRALEGFVRSAAKELRGGATGQLVYVTPGEERNLDSTLRFLLSAKSAYVDAQVIRVGPGESTDPDRLGAAARGQGRARHRRVARDR